MRRQFIALAATALSATLLAGTVAGAATASAAVAGKSGHERLHAVSHSDSANWVRVNANGVLRASGHFRPRALAGSIITERMAFKRGSFLVTMHVTHRWESAPIGPPGCRFREHLSGTYRIHGGMGRFARATGSGHFYIHIRSRLARRHGLCTGRIAVFRQATTTWGSLRW
jgi:hypothetical protein